MSAEIKGVDQLRRRLAALRFSKSSSPVIKALVRIGALLQTQIRLELRRSGLKRRTGDLANSIDFEVRQGKTGPEVVAGSFGVKYAAIHEFGYRGPQQVPAHARLIRTAWGRPIPARLVDVRAHTRRQNIPARPFVRPAFDRQKARILDILSKTIGKS